MPKVMPERKKYAQVLDFQPFGFNEVWLIIKLPINPKKKVKANLAIFLPSLEVKMGSFFILHPQ